MTQGEATEDMIELKRQLVQVLTEGELSAFFASAKGSVARDSDAGQRLVLLEARYRDLQKKEQRGVIGTEDQILESNRIREQLLLWVDGLKEHDLGQEGSSPAVKRKIALWMLAIVVVLMAGLVATWLSTANGKSEPAESPNPDTSAQLLPEPPPISDSTQQTVSLTPAKPKNSEQSTSKSSGDSNRPTPVEIRLNVLARWRNSSLKVDGDPVEPRSRIGTYIMVALSPGTHRLQLSMDNETCERSITVERAGQEIPLVCD